MQLVLPSMKERGSGWIVNISSRIATHPGGPPFDESHRTGGFSGYATAKAGLNRMSTALAAELYDSGIAVNTLAPWDTVATPGALHHDYGKGVPLEPPELMAEAALRLASSLRTSSRDGSPTASRCWPNSTRWMAETLSPAA